MRKARGTRVAGNLLEGQRNLEGDEALSWGGVDGGRLALRMFDPRPEYRSTTNEAYCKVWSNSETPSCRKYLVRNVDAPSFNLEYYPS